MKIRSIQSKDRQGCLKIADCLNDWFSEETLQEMAKKILDYSTFVYEEKGDILGFITLREVNSGVEEIVWIAVAKNYHRAGIGTKLLKYAENHLKSKQILKVKTLDNTEDYKPYEISRAFYENNGFIKITVIDPYPGWELGNPCAIYIKPINW